MEIIEDKAQLIISEFNSVIEKFNKKFTGAKTQVEKDLIDKEYEEIISKAETELEKKLEDLIKEEQDSLKKEQEVSEQELTDLEESGKIEDEDLLEEIEDEEIKSNGRPLVNTFINCFKKNKTIEYLVKKFKEEELISIGKEFGFEDWTTKGLKKDKVISLLEYLNKKK